MPHMPPPQKSVPHIPLPHVGAGSASLLRPERAANVEYCAVRWLWPQDGQWTASASALARTSFSNLVPQSSHAYSKIGMSLS